MPKVSVQLSHRPGEPVVMNEDDVPQLAHQGLVLSVTPAETGAAVSGAGAGQDASSAPPAGGGKPKGGKTAASEGKTPS